MRPDVHTSGVPPKEERLAVLVRLINEIERALGDLFVHSLHTLNCERTCVLADLLAPWPEARIRRGRIFRGRGLTLENAAGAEHSLELGIFRIVRILRFLFGVQVVEVAEEYVEAVNGRH